MRVERVVVLLLSLSTAVLAQYSGEIDLGTANVILTGENVDDTAGWHIALAGDVNDDGLDDILIGAPFHDDPTDSLVNGKDGIVYLIYGRETGWPALLNLGDADASFVAELPNNQASHDVFGLGDVNGDGIEDFGIGVKFFNRDGIIRVGKVYIFFGRSSGWAPLTSLSEADASFLGAGDRSESAHVNPVGDINGDEYDDLIIGAGFNKEADFNAGKVYVFFGRPSEEWSQDLLMDEADASYLGERAGDWAGHRVAGCGDVNGDGLGDFLVGANRRDSDSLEDCGIAYLILGRTSGWAQNVSLAEADAIFPGPEIEKIEVGWNVCGPGDMNGDGLNDLLIGGAGRSRVYLVFGREQGWTRDVALDSIADAVLLGEHPRDFTGGDMRTLEDINGDGLADAIIGAYNNDQNGSNAGVAYIVLGRSNWPAELDLANTNAVFIGEAADDNAGFSVAGGGDVNNDGTGDLLVSAPQNDRNGVNSGSVYLFLTPQVEFSLISPAGGEMWDIGTRQAIQWSSSEPEGDVRVEISRDGGLTWQTTHQTADVGSVEWEVAGPESDSCLCRITQVNTGLSDLSRTFFSIVLPSLTLLSPNGGENWTVDEQREITWESRGDIPAVSLSYSTDNGASWDDVAVSILNDGRTTWRVPGPPSSEVLVAVSDAADSEPADTSDAVFTVSPKAVLNVLSPNGGESWIIGAAEEIVWNAQNTSGAVRIELSRDNGATWEALEDSTSDDGSLFWNVTGPPSSACWIRISDINGTAADSSDAAFIITGRPVLTVLAPNGGESWEIGVPESIAWSSEYIDSDVKIELSRDAGSSWTVLEQALRPDSSLIWTVEGPPADSCLVRVSAADNSAADTSDSVFSIAEAPALTLTEPDGGEIWEIYSEVSLSWASVNINAALRIELSRDNGATWEVLTDSTDDSGAWTWEVMPPASEFCLVRISDLEGLASDSSDAFFTIRFKTGIEGTADLPREFALEQNYPNPFNPDTRLRFDCAEQAHVKVLILNVNGRTVRTLVDGIRPRGRHEVRWDGRDDRGARLASGLYFARFTTAKAQFTRRMLLLK